jgi:hypothetical protein
VPRIRDQIEALLTEADELEERIRTWQEADEAPPRAQLLADTRAYEAWYAKARRFVTEEHADEFKDMYEGGVWTNRIRAFLSDPMGVSALWDEAKGADQPFPKYTNVFQTAFKENFDRQRAALTMAMDTETAVVSLLDELTEIFRRFPEYLAVLAARQNDRVRAPVIENEADLQIVVEAILRLHYDDVRPEDYVPEYAGGRSRVDFLLRESGVIIETKMTRLRLRDKDVGEELAIDWIRYRRHPDCRAVLALIFDPGRFIANAAGLERDLSQTREEPATRAIVIR